MSIAGTELAKEQRKRRLPSVATMIAHIQAGLTVDDIGKMYGVGESAVRGFLSRNGLSLVDLRNWKRTRADLLSLKQSQMLEEITPEKMKAASTRDLVAGIVGLHGVERLERGQSTQNVDVQELTGRLDELTAAENALRKTLGKPLLPEDAATEDA